MTFLIVLGLLILVPAQVVGVIALLDTATNLERIAKACEASNRSLGIGEPQP